MNISEGINLLRIALSGQHSEAQLRDLFMVYLPRMFTTQAQNKRIDRIALGSEEFIETAPTNNTSSEWGFMDTFAGKVILEFKADLLNSSNLQTGMEELRRYLAGLWTKYKPTDSFCGLLTDIKTWHLYRPVPTHEPDNGQYTEEMVSLNLVEKIVIKRPEKEQIQNFMSLLERVLFRDNLTVLTAKGLRRDFGPESGYYSWILPEIAEIVRRANSCSKPNLHITLWKEYQEYNIEYDKNSRGLFEDYSKQLYLVLLARILVGLLFSKNAQITVNRSTMKNLISGEFHLSRMRLLNFVDRDFFGWISDSEWIDEFVPIAYHLFHGLRTYDFELASDENVLRLVYDSLLPRKRSDLLGQRSTPEKLTRGIVQELTEDRQPPLRILDPACGSGTFLRTLLQDTLGKIHPNLGANEKIERLVQLVTGIDIDPIAVIISKAVWSITLSSLLVESDSRIVIPIYLADSLFSTNALPNSSSNTSVRIEFDDASIDIPISLLDSQDLFDRYVDLCMDFAEKLAELHKNDENALRDAVESLFKEDIPAFRDIVAQIDNDEDTPIIEPASDLVYELAQRVMNDRNGVWAFIVCNNYRPSLLAGKFDIVVANLPWLAMSAPSNPAYKNRLEYLADRYGIKPSGSSFLHLEIATTFLLHVVSHFLHSDGECAFVMTRSVFDGNHHDAFRRMEFKNAEKSVAFVIDEIWDLEGVEDLFDLESCVVFGHKGQLDDIDSSCPIPARKIDELPVDTSQSKYSKLNLTYLGRYSVWAYDEMILEITEDGHYRDSFKQGADLMPRTALFVDIIDDSNSSRNLLRVRTSSVEQQNSLNKILKHREFEGLVEKPYIYTTVYSKVLLPFYILDDPPLVVLPARMQNGQPRIVSDMEMIMGGDKNAKEWFEKIDSEDDLQDKSLRERVNNRNKLTNQDYQQCPCLVHYGAGGEIPCAAVQRNPGGLDFPFVADQTTYVACVNDPEEAYYVSGLINSDYLREKVRAFQSKGLFGARHVHKKILSFIPKFDDTNPIHSKIAEESRNMERKAKEQIDEYLADATLRVHTRRRELRKRLESQVQELNKLAKQAIEDAFSAC